MLKQYARRAMLLAATTGAAALAACSDNPLDSDPGHEHAEPVSAELIDRGTGERLAYVHGDHWHGHLHLEQGEELSVTVNFLDEQDNIIELGDDYSVRVSVEDGAPDDLVVVDGQGDQVSIRGDASGETRLVFQLWHGNHADWATPALPVEVHAPMAEAAGAEVFRAGTDDRLAYVHGDHWHGSLPHIHTGEDLSLAIRFVDENGEVVELTGEYRLAPEWAEGAATDVVSIQFEGDQVDIHGVAEGKTSIVFQLWHGDHTEYVTPPLGIEVDDH